MVAGVTTVEQGSAIGPAPASTSGLRLSILGPRDEDALAGLFRANNRPEVRRYFDPFPLTDATARRLVTYEGRDKHWGMWVNDELAGLLMVRGWDGGHPHPTLGALIDRRFRGGGLVHSALELVIAELRAMGEPVLRAQFHEDNWATFRAVEKNPVWRIISRGGGRVVVEHPVTTEPA